jgi:hypothetical protein
VNLKYNYPVLLFLLAFGATVYFSFKHEHAPPPADTVSATPEERLDQLTLSAMHAEPAPLTSAAPQLVSSTASAATEIHATAEDLAKVHVLDEILATKNDNDPRMDKDLRMLSPAAKALIRGRYGATAAEKRNQRGTMVFLVGRELNTADDVAFMHSVLTESPCLSLANCAQEDKGSVQAADRHHEGETETTLAYPQLIALKSIEAYLGQPGAGELSASLLAELEAARHSPVRKVASMADEISRAYHTKHP